ncbi:MAG: hypothetical protein AAFP82_22515, partial [Bacteroidota bacterium]
EISMLEQRQIMFEFEDKERIVQKNSYNSWLVEWGIGEYNSLKDYPISTDELELEITPTTTYSTVINIEKVIDRNWSVGAGVGYSVADFNANYDLNFAYSMENEQQTANGFEKAYRHTLPSLLNPIDAEFVLVRSTTITSGADIPLSLELNHSIQHFNVPLYTKYRIHRNKWSYYVKFGVVGNVLLSDLSTDHIETTSNNSSIQSLSSSFEAQSSNPISKNNFSLSYLTSIGAQFRLPFNTYLFFEPNFSGEIIATYPDAATGDKIINLGGQVGVGYEIR